MNTCILLFLSWIIPIICFLIAVYCIMDKGESLEEFVDKQDTNDAFSLIFIFSFIPIINIIFLFSFIIIGFFFLIFLLIKDWRK